MIARRSIRSGWFVLAVALCAACTVPKLGDLGQRLSSVSTGQLTTVYRLFEGDTHNSMIPGFIASSLRHGLACVTR